MRTLAHNRLYSREKIMREMLAAGQFAHLRPEQIEAEVASLYDENRPMHEQGEYVFQAIERAVPNVLLRAVQSGFAKECFDGEVINFVAMRLGVTCCLCLSIDMPEARSNWTLPTGFLGAVCPTFLCVEAFGDHVKASQPACRKCRRSLDGYFWRVYGLRGPRNNDDWDSALAWLLTNPGFRERVVDNAPNAALLRFDPRRPPQRAAA